MRIVSPLGVCRIVSMIRRSILKRWEFTWGLLKKAPL